MPKVPVYESQVGLPQRATTDVPQGGAGVVGEAARRLGQEVQKVGTALQSVVERQQREKQQAWKLEALTQFQKFSSDYALNKVRNVSGRDAIGLYDTSREEYESQIQGITDSAPTPEMAQEMGLRLRSYSEPDLRSLAKHEASEFRSYNKNMLEAGYNAAVETAANGYEDIALVDELVENTISDYAGFHSEDEMAVLAPKVRDGIYASAAKERVQADPERALEDLNSSAWDERLTEKTKDALLGDAQRHVDRLEAERERARREEEARLNRVAADLWSRAPDALASIRDSGSEGGLDLETKLRALGTEAATEKANEYRRKKGIAFKTRNAMVRMDGMPFAQQMEMVERDFSYTPGELGAADKIQSRDALMGEVQKNFVQFLKDPAAYVGPKTAEIISEGDTPEHMIRTSMRLQEELAEGLPGFEPSPLSKDQKAQLADAWSQLSVDEKLGFQSELAAYGEFAPLIEQEIGIDPQTHVAWAMFETNPEMIEGARTLIESGSLKISDMPGTDAEKNDMKRDIEDTLEGSEFWEALRGPTKMQPYNTQRLAFLGQLQKGIEMVALRTGDADKAISMFEDTFNSISDDNFAMVVFPKTYDRGDMEDLLEQKRKDVRPLLEYQKQLIGNDRLWEEKMSDIEDDGVWINAPDGDGFVLLDPTTGLQLVDKDSQPIRVRYEPTGAW